MTKILLIEDDTIILRATSAILTHANFEVITANNGKDGLRKAFECLPDLILCDIMMPGLNGYEVLEKLKSTLTDCIIPFIFLTGRDGREDIRRGMHLGADDYLTKPFTQVELLDAIQTQLNKYHAIKTHYQQYVQKIQESVEKQSQYDSVTGIQNFIYLQEQFSFFINRLNQQQIGTPRTHFYLPVSLIKLERLEKLKQVLNYESYNALLNQIVARLQQDLPPQDQVALLGDGEFGILSMPIKERAHIQNRASKLIDLFNSPFMIEDRELFLDVRMGICLYPRDGHSLDELVKNARSTLENVARFTQIKYQLCSNNFNLDNEKKAYLETELHYAIARDQLQVFYQPQVNVQTGQITGLEALIRWEHPEKGMISPADFIPIAEETGLIESIGYWVLETATNQVKKWQTTYQEDLRLALNISGYQLNNPTICHDIIRVLVEQNFDPQYLDLEITESILIEDFQHISDTLKKLQKIGIKIAMDDFGTGYSSFNYTRLFPWDILKIDRCFIHDVDQNPINAAITKGLIEMSHALGFKVIAEGVEKSSELALLHQYRCDEVQGYFLGRPLPEMDIEVLLLQNMDQTPHYRQPSEAV